MKKTYQKLIYINTKEAYKEALNIINLEHDLLITDNPLLANNSKYTNIIDISKTLNQKQSIKFGKITLKLLKNIEIIFENNNLKNEFGYYSNKLNLYMVLKSLFFTLLDKSYMIKEFLKTIEYENILFIINKSKAYEKENPWTIPRFSNPYQYLIENNFFPNSKINKKYICNITYPQNINDTKDQSFILRILVWPLSYFFYNLFKFIFFINSKRLFIVKTCESLKETFLWLGLKGFKLKELKYSIFNGNLEDIKLLNDKYLSEIEKVIEENLNIYFTKDECQAIKSIYIKHITLGLNYLTKETDNFENFILNNISNTNEKKFILTAGFYGPIASQINFICKKYNIGLIGFEHGLSTGISHSHSIDPQSLESNMFDLFLVSNQAAKKEYNKVKNNIISVIGEANQKSRINLKLLQRYIVRKRLNIKTKKNTIIHVSGMIFPGNLKGTIDSPNDNYVYTRENKLLTKVYNSVNKNVVYKTYPSNRLLYQPKYYDIHDLSKNIFIPEFMDFRYIRALADIIVTDSNQSTLSWCLVKNVPLIYLKSNYSYRLLNKEVENLFEKSFFVIDTDILSWEENLLDILNKPLNDLRIIWNKKSSYRKRLISNFLLGPKSITGKNASLEIKKYYSMVKN